MFAIKIEGFGQHSPFIKAIHDACVEVLRRSELAQQITRPKTRQAMENWFGDADIGDVWANIARMEKVIADSKRTVTFVNAVGKLIRVEYNPDNIAQSPTFPATPPTPQEMEGVSAWVYPTVTGSGSGKGNITDSTPLFHTGSGMRLYLGYATVSQAPIDEKDLVHTIYHELTHKVIGTNDHAYGAVECKKLIADGRALKNADNYAFFLMELD